MSRKLYLVPTPVGNLEDMTPRAVRVLRQVSVVLVEDTRVSKKLFDHYEIPTPMDVFHEHNKDQKIPAILEKLKDADIALISDAGTPAISDPGYELVQACIEKNITIIPLPGSTAFVPALIASGLPTDAFSFLGFLAKKTGPRKKTLELWKHVPATLIFYESPYRVLDTLQDISEVLGNRNACIAREISKKFESFYRAPINDLSTFVSENPLAGEIVIMVEGFDEKTETWTQDTLDKALIEEMSAGTGVNQAAKQLANISGWKKSQIYQRALDLQKDQS